MENVVRTKDESYEFAMVKRPDSRNGGKATVVDRETNAKLKVSFSMKATDESWSENRTAQPETDPNGRVPE